MREAQDRLCEARRAAAIQKGRRDWIASPVARNDEWARHTRPAHPQPPALLDPEMVADGQEEEEEQHGGDDVLGDAEGDHAVGNVEVNARGQLSGGAGCV